MKLKKINLYLLILFTSLIHFLQIQISKHTL